MGYRQIRRHWRALDREYPPTRVVADYGEHASSDVTGDVGLEVAAHIARWNPSVTLAHCDMVDALVALHRPISGPRHPASYLKVDICGVCDFDKDGLYDAQRIEALDPGVPSLYPCATVRHIAAVYRLRPDGTVHPEWREEWAVG